MSHRWICPKDGARLTSRFDSAWWDCPDCGLPWLVPSYAIVHDGGVDAAVARGVASMNAKGQGPYR